MKNYTVVGLTGQTGSGKTTVSRVFSENGFEVIDCDKLSRAVTADGSECNKALAKHFPDCVDNEYHLDRNAMAAVVFNDTIKLKLLNDTIFPFITAEINRNILTMTKNGAEYILLDAPTLFEAKADKLCDVIVSCIADASVRKKRIIERDDISAELAESRIASQHSDEFFINNSDYIIKNNGSLQDAELQTAEIINKIKGNNNG
ncbi:MAG: dephospho-CoA kinase [Oscillospiraceae bacterium]